MRDRDTPADRREGAQAQQKRKAANTKVGDNKRRRLDVAVGVSQINPAKKQDAWQRHKAAKEQKEKYVQVTLCWAEDPCDFSDNGQDEADSDEGEDLVGPTVVDGADGAATVAIVNKVATSIMDDDDESVIPGVVSSIQAGFGTYVQAFNGSYQHLQTPQPKAQALQSSIAGQALRRNPPQGRVASRTPGSSSSFARSSPLVKRNLDVNAPYDGAHNRKPIDQETLDSKPNRRQASDLTLEQKMVAGAWFQTIFMQNILDGQGLWRTKRSLYAQSQLVAEVYNENAEEAYRVIVSKNLGVLNLIKRTALKYTYKAYKLDPDRQREASTAKAVLYLQPTKWAAKELRCGAGTRCGHMFWHQAAYNIFLPQGGVDMNDCSFEAEDDFQNDLLYEIFVQIVAGIRKEKSAAFQWPKEGLDPNDNDHRELAFALLTHAYAGVRYAMQVLTPPPSLPESSDAGRNANVAKQTVALWHEFSATHYQGPVMAILRRRRREDSGPFYSEAIQVRVTNRVQNSVEVALLEEYRGPGVSRRGTSDEMRITAQRACDFEESLFT
ncbi:BZ3500_MvSof-1268-A1-R1_Chr2-1g04144 [Microbotryum saponariae]|uniref:BZ3500_MvSof-1268-A1-R1_Chr2-1g04144 protein n=1 Tax=Microbotryum saponariae TaxID=289078 RepID=A0A2X0KXQ5_9BASI|nr:BZ3500_MvSof-1268-A1-R1_Chr2-1g04144 [Microbotryum saponariae]SCZ91131.1 BZ3501_MvSof-1269-A2-R1_Chr2-1g03800 [Microbotryum saponariae]